MTQPFSNEFFFFQNAMRATIETHDDSNSLPPVKVLVSLGGEDLSIKVCGNVYLPQIFTLSRICVSLLRRLQAVSPETLTHILSAPGSEGVCVETWVCVCVFLTSMSYLWAAPTSLIEPIKVQLMLQINLYCYCCCNKMKSVWCYVS